MTSAEVADAVADGLHRGFLARLPQGVAAPEIIKLSVADGGEGTALALTRALGGRKVSAQASDPLGRPIEASYGIVGQDEEGTVAIIDVAAASGLTLLSKAERNPLKTSSFGSGELILDALDRGCRRFVIGLGGSATNDGGLGMLAALGVRFTGADGADLPGRGCDLEKVESIDLSYMVPAVREAAFTVACDVNTPFCGPGGASEVFAPQKGARGTDVGRLDAGMAHFAGKVKEYLGADISRVEGSGAAGGLGGAFIAFLGGELRSGVDIVLDSIGFDNMIRDASLIITGEGRADSQTPKGKTAAGVLRRAKAAGVPAVLIAGLINHCEELDRMGFAAMIEVSPREMSLAEALDKDTARRNISVALSAFEPQF